jgi:RNA polymerase sigma-70 factor (ECF subfamily)
MDQLNKDQRFTELLRQHHIQLFGYFFAMVHDLHDAEDLCQQTSIVLWKKFGAYREGTSFFSWAMAAAKYELLNYYRVRKHRRQFSSELSEWLTDDFNQFDADLLQSRIDALQECKAGLREDDRRVLEACYESEQSFREAADQLGRSHKSVYRALDRIRVVLMKCIEDRLGKQAGGA